MPRSMTSFRTATALAASMSLLTPGFTAAAFAQQSEEQIRRSCGEEVGLDPAALDECIAQRTPAGEQPAAADPAPAETAPAEAIPAEAPAAEAAPTEESAPAEVAPAAEAAPAEAAPAEAPVADAAPAEAAPVEAATPPVTEAPPESAAEPTAPDAAPETAAPEAAADPATPEAAPETPEAAPETTSAAPADQPAAAADPSTPPAPEAPAANAPAGDAPAAGSAVTPPATEAPVSPTPPPGDTAAPSAEAPAEAAPADTAAPAAGAPAADAPADDAAAPAAPAPDTATAPQDPAAAPQPQTQAPVAETPTESAIAEEVAAKPEPDLSPEQEEARDQASAALQALMGGDASQAIAAAAGTDAVGEVDERTVAEGETRTSDQDFETQAVVTEQKDNDERFDRNDKILLGALGALAVGTLLVNRSRVVSNSGDRVVVQREDGGLQVLKDDGVLIRQPGSDVRTERFDDGSTRQSVVRADGSTVVTIRDASLRVLKREVVQPDGTRYLLIDDTETFEPVDVATLPNVSPAVSSRSGDDPLASALAREQGLDRRFSLSQVRNIAEVRALAPAFDVSSVTFASGSAAITPDQAPNLNGLAQEVLKRIQANPREVFLVEGHTDAVGDAAFNLALSDRRAESLALALNEYFGVPVENMVVQGYGESFLLVPTQADEVKNRRATLRQITGLLQTAAASN